MPKMNITDYAKNEAYRLFSEIMKNETYFDTPERVLSNILDGLYNDEVKGKGSEAINSGVNFPMDGVAYKRVKRKVMDRTLEASVYGEDDFSVEMYWYEAWAEYIEEQILHYLIKMAERRLSKFGA